MGKLPTVQVRLTQQAYYDEPDEFSYVTMDSVIINADDFDPAKHRMCRVIKHVPTNGNRAHYHVPSDITKQLAEWSPVEIDVSDMTVKEIRRLVDGGVVPYEIEQLALAEGDGKRRQSVFQVLASALVRTWKNSTGHPTAEEMRTENRIYKKNRNKPWVSYTTSAQAKKDAEYLAKTAALADKG